LNGLDRFKAQLRGNICSFFDSPDTLATDVVRAVGEAARAPRKSNKAREVNAADNLAVYRKALERQLRRVKFLGFGEQFQISLPIPEVWGALSAAVPRSFEAEDVHGRKDFDAELVRDTPVEDAFRKASEYDLRGIVMLGDPGSGKTTAARRLAWQAADL